MNYRFSRKIPKTDNLWEKTKNFNHGKCGSLNLGNTCYMNSAIACLSNCIELTSYFLSGEYDYEKEINEKNERGTGGKISIAWHDLLKEYWLSNQNCGRPNKLKYIMGQFVPRFSGYNQQDSCEFITYFLNFINEDLNKCKVRKFKRMREQLKNEKDIECAQRYWNYFIEKNDSIISDIFTGIFKNSILCKNCKRYTIKYETFDIAQLPIPQKKLYNNYIKREINIYRNNSYIEKFVLKTKSNIKICELFNIFEKYNKKIFDKNKFICIEVINKRFNRFIELDETYENNKEESKIYFFEIKNKKKENKYYPIHIYRYKLDHEKIIELSDYPRILTIDKISNFDDIILNLYNLIKDYIKIDKKYQSIKEIIKNQKNLPFKFILKNFDKNEIDLIEEYLKNLKNQNNLKKILSKIIDEKYSISIYLYDKKNNFIDFNKFEIKNIPTTNYNINNDISIEDCFEAFRQEEDINDDWYCGLCKKISKIKKKIELFYLPKIFIICLKRFINMRKNDKLIDFKLDNINLKDFVCGPERNNNIYDCFAISQHYGSIYSGHYTSVCKNIDGKWYKYDDTQCNQISYNDIVNSAAFVIFFRRKNDMLKK